jgi:hypothetical protein
MSISVTDGLTAYSASSAEGNSRQPAKRQELLVWRRFGGIQNNTGLATAGEGGERAAVPVAHRGGLSLSKPLSLRSLR